MKHLSLLTYRRSHIVGYLTDGHCHVLNVINTYKKNRKGHFTDSINSYHSFISWCEKAGVIDWNMYLQLNIEQNCYQDEAKEIFDDLTTARMFLKSLIGSLMASEGIDVHALRFFNEHLHIMREHLRFDTGERGLALYWYNIHEQMAAPIWFIMASAEQLIIAGRAKKIKVCPACSSFFLDETRPGNKTWCNTFTCGSISKSANYYSQKYRSELEASNINKIEGIKRPANRKPLIINNISI